MGDNFITLHSNDYNRRISVIEVQLPNPYLNINKPEGNKTIEYRIKSKFKSPFADYINHSLTSDTSNFKGILKREKFINSNKIDNKFHFTRTQDVMEHKK